YERHAYTILKRVLGDGPEPLHEFRARIGEDASANHKTYQAFSNQVPESLERRGLLDRTGRGVTWLTALVIFGLGLVLMIGSLLVPGPVSQGPVVPFAIGIGLLIGSFIFLALAAPRRVNVRRTKDGALSAARWDAFRRYLKDFSRLEEAPAISLALWDKFLIYGIAFGVASQVLEHARLHAPAELVEQSSIYWYGTHGYSGGSSENAFA